MPRFRDGDEVQIIPHKLPKGEIPCWTVGKAYPIRLFPLWCESEFRIIDDEGDLRRKVNCPGIMFELVEKTIGEINPANGHRTVAKYKEE